jgi:hypothetical protein
VPPESDDVIADALTEIIWRTWYLESARQQTRQPSQIRSRPGLWALACFSVELPGIEPATKIVLTCGNTEFEDAKRREST